MPWLQNRAQLLYDVASIYGVQFSNYVLPLITVPYLSRVLGPAGWGLIAMAQAFAMYGGLIVEYGFVYYGTREIATAAESAEIENVVAGISAAKALLSVAVIGMACLAYQFIPLFHRNPLLLWVAVFSELIKASLPNYYFYGVNRIAVASILDVSARIAAAAGIFVFVHRPSDSWKVFALQATGAMIAFFVGHVMIYSRHAWRRPQFGEGVRMLRGGGAMFLFRSAHSIYVLSNAFILGLFAPVQAVGYYAGAEKINSAAMGLLSPLSTALYPRAAGMAKTSMRNAARLTALSVYAMVAVSVILGAIMWFGAPLIVRIILGGSYVPSGGVLKILAIRSPMVAWTSVLGFQWLLALGLERSFQKITIVAILFNVVLATCLAPGYSYNGMAWAVVLSQSAAALGIYIVLKRRGLSPFATHPDTSYA